jgi:Tol biopolymer transport system component
MLGRPAKHIDMKPRRTLSIILLLTGARHLGVTPGQAVPKSERWGIYSLDLSDQRTSLIYSTPMSIGQIALNPKGDALAFSMAFGGNRLEDSEIYCMHLDSGEISRLTDNWYHDSYPVWSPDGTQIAYLSWPGETLDVYRMDKNGDNKQMLYDSGYADADIDWKGEDIVFTRNSEIWIMKSDGSDPVPVTRPPRAGEKGKANLPFGDYDPRIRPGGTDILFERLVDDRSAHGNYDLFLVRMDGTGLVQLTQTSYTQGLASWCPTGDCALFIVTAIQDAGKYDLYWLDTTSQETRNITPDYFPGSLLIHQAIFAQDNQHILFIAEWWQ